MKTSGRSRRICWTAAGLIAALLMGLLATAGPASAQNAIGSGCFESNGVEVKVCIYQQGTSVTSGKTSQHINIDRYVFVVTNEDPHDVVIDKAHVRFAVYGKCLSGCAHYSDQVTNHSIGGKPAGRHTYVPYWHRATTLADSSGANWQAADASVTYSMRGKHHTFATSSICQGYIPAGVFNDCL